MNGAQFLIIYIITYAILMVGMHKLVAHLKAKQEEKIRTLEKMAADVPPFLKNRTPMKKIPAKYHLNEDEIKEAIAEWLANNHDIEDDVNITFSVEHKQEQPQTPYRGGMSDWVDIAVITAVAEVTE